MGIILRLLSGFHSLCPVQRATLTQSSSTQCIDAGNISFRRNHWRGKHPPQKINLQHIPSYLEAKLVPLIGICISPTAPAALNTTGKMLIETLEDNCGQTEIVITDGPAPAFISSSKLTACGSVKRINKMYHSGRCEPLFCKKTRTLTEKCLLINYLCMVTMASLVNSRPILKNYTRIGTFNFNFCLSSCTW